MGYTKSVLWLACPSVPSSKVYLYTYILPYSMGYTKKLLEDLFQDMYHALQPDEEIKSLEEKYLYELNQSRKPKTKEK